ncbi:MAG: glycerophosphoryl diester phosphodiesterase, partial [Bacteroidia bacterium]
EAVVFHDRNLSRMCSVDRDIYSVELAALSQYTVSSAQRLGSHASDTYISRLSELGDLIQKHPAVTLYVEIKQDILEHFSRAQTLAVLAQALHSVRSRTVLISFDYAILHEAAALEWRVGPVLCQWEDARERSVFPARAECLFLDSARVPDGERLDSLPLPCVVYEIGTASLAQEWLARGASKVETYCIGEMLEPLMLLVEK